MDRSDVLISRRRTRRPNRRFDRFLPIPSSAFEWVGPFFAEARAGGVLEQENLSTVRIALHSEISG
jgi:hypothetical protein